MKITIINTEKSEKRYAREELDAFVSQLKDGTQCQAHTCEGYHETTGTEVPFLHHP